MPDICGCLRKAELSATNCVIKRVKIGQLWRGTAVKLHMECICLASFANVCLFAKCLTCHAWIKKRDWFCDVFPMQRNYTEGNSSVGGVSQGRCGFRMPPAFNTERSSFSSELRMYHHFQTCKFHNIYYGSYSWRESRKTGPMSICFSTLNPYWLYVMCLNVKLHVDQTKKAGKITQKPFPAV